jgi:hypothetical protein
VVSHSRLANTWRSTQARSTILVVKVVNVVIVVVDRYRSLEYIPKSRVHRYVC